MTKQPRHPIQVVARRTGLTVDVLRVWERRYAAVSPGRSSANRRLYSDDDVERLLLIRRATLGGRPISDVARMSNEDLRRTIEADGRAEAAVPRRPDASAPFAAETAMGDPRSRLKACLHAIAELDGARLRGILHGTALELGTLSWLRDVVTPLMVGVGEEWRAGRLGVHHEHFATALVRSLLDAVLDGQDRVAEGPEILLTTPPGEEHELGALMVGALASVGGWRVAYLGRGLPFDDVAAAASLRRARAVGVSIVFRAGDPGLAEELRTLRRRLPSATSLVVGGRAASTYQRVLEEIGAVTVEDVAAARSTLDRLRRSSP